MVRKTGDFEGLPDVLSYQEASDVSGLSVTFLQRLVEASQIACVELFEGEYANEASGHEIDAMGLARFVDQMPQ